jgi:transcriptional regulator with XRE-family HTH domain
MSRNKPKELLTVVGKNLQKIAKEHDLSSRDIGSRANMPQATVYKLLEGQHNPNLSTIESICNALLIHPAVLMMPFLPTSMLMSKRVPKLVESYAKLNPEQRDQVEDFIKNLLDH